jgi:hypothetical protein
MTCTNPGRCCNRADCTTGVARCNCKACSGLSWSSDNDCRDGACWLNADGVYSCIQTNPCDCVYRGGEFAGAATTCPGDGSGPPPPPPPPPPPEDPGPIQSYCCDSQSGMCYQENAGFCSDGRRRFTSMAACVSSCRANTDPDPPPDPDPTPCDPPCGACQDCVSGVCVNRCSASQCCNGVCCAANETCVNGVCTPASNCTGSCRWRLDRLAEDGTPLWWTLLSACTSSGCDCNGPTTNPGVGGIAVTPCYRVGNSFP